MKDVISVHLGQAGVQLGLSVWELLGYEHNIAADGELQRSQSDLLPLEEGNVMGTFYQSFYHQQALAGHYTPRAILVDLESSVIDNISRTKYCKLFDSNFVIKGVEDAANNFARAYHIIGRKEMRAVREAIRKQAENSAFVNGFMAFHSMGGGTGSGLGTRLAMHLANYYPKKAFVQVVVFPSPRTATAVVEPYNTILATHESMDVSKCVVFVDNEATYNVCHDKCGIDEPKTSMMNSVISQAVSSITSSSRFDSQQTADFNDFHTNLIPFPRLHFPTVSLSPVVGCKFSDEYTVHDITTIAFESPSRLAHFVDQGTHIASCLLYRGDVSAKDVNETILNIKHKKIDRVSWIPTGFKIGISPKRPLAVFNGKPVEMLRSVCLMSNNTGLRSYWDDLMRKYELMLSKWAFVHWYLREGLTLFDFTEALEDMKVLLDEYRGIVKD